MHKVVFGLVAAWLTPILAVAAFSTGLPFGVSVAIGGAAALAAATLVATPVAHTMSPLLGGRPWVTVLVVTLSAVAVLQIARASMFAADANRVACSVLPSDAFRVGHSCVSAYAEAARFVEAGDVNIYAEALYQPRTLGGLNVDTYHYPPPFLLMPAAIRAMGGGFFVERARWFVVQALLLGVSLFWLAWWIGGRPGAGAALAGIALLCLPQATMTLQTGNFQATAIPVGLVALALLLAGRVRAGAPLLAFVAVSKIFPGALIVYLAAARRWRALAWTAGSGIVLVLMALAAFGTKPFVDFVTYEVPRISDGRAFPQSERPQIVANNQSMYGLTVRLRRLGVTVLDQPTGLAVTSAYGVGVLLLAALAGWRSRLDLSRAADRLLLIQVGLALLTLASFRSPFVGGVYGLLSSFWLLFLLAAGSRNPAAIACWAGAGVLASLAHWQLPSPRSVPSLPIVWLSVGLLSLAIVVSCWTALGSVRGSVRPA